MTTDETPTRPPLTPAAREWLDRYPRTLEEVLGAAPDEGMRLLWTWAIEDKRAFIERTGDIPRGSWWMPPPEDEEDPYD